MCVGGVSNCINKSGTTRGTTPHNTSWNIHEVMTLCTISPVGKKLSSARQTGQPGGSNTSYCSKLQINVSVQPKVAWNLLEACKMCIPAQPNTSTRVRKGARNGRGVVMRSNFWEWGEPGQGLHRRHNSKGTCANVDPNIVIGSITTTITSSKRTAETGHLTFYTIIWVSFKKYRIILVD